MKVKYLKSKKKRKLPKLEFPENLRYSNFNGAMHNFWSVNVWQERKASVNKNALVCIYWNKDVRIG